jgi:AraC-like DNA-binding protein
MLLEHLDAAIARGEPKGVVFALPGGLPPPGAAMVSGGRLTLVTDGIKHIQAWDGARVIDHWLPAGHVIVMPPYGWTLPRYDSARTILGIVRHTEFTRYLWSHHVGRGSGGPPDLWFHTPRPMPAGFAQALGALCELANGGPPVAPGLVWIVLRFARAELAHAESAPQDRARATWNALSVYVHQHLEKDISRDGLARRFRLHPSYVSLLFSKIGGEAFGAYLTRLRLERAVQLLRQELPVNEVARASGFSDPGYFIKVFRRRYGATPGRYLRA